MLEVRLLGQFDVRLNESRVNIPTLPARSLFAYLLLNADFPQRREKLAALFWPDASEANARTSLRQALWRIRKAFEEQLQEGAGIIVADDLSVGIDPTADLWLDTAVLKQEANSLDELITAVSVYEGDLLPDCFDDWAVVEREFYQVLFSRQMQRLLDGLVEAQRWPEVVSWAERWITLGQAPEPAYRALMYAHAGLGDISQVAIVYRRCKDALRRELGVEPSEHTAALRDRLVKGKSSLTRGYDLRELVSKSPITELYRAYQPALEREVAVRVISPRYANRPDFIRRFESEAQLIARLDHPHIRTLFDFWRDPGGAYLVMPWLDGGNLRQQLQRGPLATEVFVRLLDQTAAALNSAHSREIIHGQLQPENVLFDQEGNAYLTDFRIALDSEVGSGVTTTSFPYLAPEQAQGEPPSAPGDQYSLAMIFYEVLCGSLPESADELAAWRDKSLPSELSTNPDLLVRQVLARALAANPNERYPGVLDMAAALRKALLAELPAGKTAGVVTTPSVEVTNPYKGLHAFREADAADFFGREALVQRIVGRLSEPGPAARFLALVGPSGSGKSSVIRAGLIPALRQGALPGSTNWFILKTSTGTQPLVDLEADLLHIAAHKQSELGALLQADEHGLVTAVQQVLPDQESELLLFIDQFEELFMRVEDMQVIEHFLSLLATAVTDPASRVRVIVALRADFYDRPLLHLAFGALMRARTEVVIPMSADELRQVIVAPAERAGLALEPGLPTTLVAEVMKRPNALPLLQYALTEMFEQRDGRLLTRRAYEAIGGVAKALARRAETVYGELTPLERQAARQMFLRLVNPEDSEGRSLRQVPLSELRSISAGTAVVEVVDLDQWAAWALENAGIPGEMPDTTYEVHLDPAAVDTVLQAFGRSRLLAFDHDPVTREPTVEIAHDALVREWRRLHEWLEDSRSDLHMHRLLANATKEWLDASQDSSYLLHGERLKQAETWAATTTLALTQDEQVLLAASLEARQQRHDEIMARQQLEQKLVQQRRRRDRFLAAAGIAGLLLIAAAILLYGVARSQAQVAFSRQLAAQCLNTRGEQYDLALLLCLEALRFAATFEARDALATLYAENPQYSHALHGHQGAVSAVTFSDDGRLLASSGADGAIFLWNMSTGEPVESAPIRQAGAVRDLALVPGTAVLAAAGVDGRVTLHEIEHGDASELPIPAAVRVASLDAAADGSTLLLGTADGRILFWELTAQRLSGTELQGHSGPVNALELSADGTTLASGGQDGSVQVWDMTTGQARAVVAQETPVLDLVLSRDGRYLAASAANGSIYLANLADDQGENALLADTTRTDALAFSPDGSHLAAGSIDGKIAFYDVADRSPLVEGMIGHSGAVTALAYSEDGHFLASGSADRSIVLREFAAVRDAHAGPISSVVFQPDGMGLASGSLDGSMRFWEPDLTPRNGQSFTGQGEGVNDLAYSPDGRFFASAGRDGTIALIDAATGQQVSSLSGHKALVTSLAFSPDGARLASGSADNTVIVWDVRSGDPAGPPLEGHEDWVLSVAFAPDGKLLASGGRDNRIILWDMERSTVVESLQGHQDWVYSLAFSHDGQWLASGGADNLAVLWDLTTKPAGGKPLAGHTGYIFDVVFSGDDALLFTGEESGIVRSWDVRTGQPIGQPLYAHHGAVYSLDSSSDSGRLASGGQDAALRLWRTDLEAWACEGAGRNLTQAEWLTALQGQAAPMVALLNLTHQQTCPQWPAG